MITCREKLKITLILFFVLAASNSYAQTDRFVAPGGTNGTNCTDNLNPCATIVYALGQADDGDTIHLEDGEYAESLQIAMNITIAGSNPETTILQPPTGLDVPVAVILSTGGPYSVTFSGLTIRNGRAQAAQGFRGGGIFNDGSNLTLQNLIFRDNFAQQQGGAVYNDGGILTAANLLFTGNEIELGSGSSFYNNNTEAFVTNATFVNNGMNHRTIVQNDGELTISNSILQGSASFAPGSEIFPQNDADVLLRYSFLGHSCTWISPGVCEDVIINTDPLFEDEGAGNFRLQHYPFNSAAVAAGDPTTPQTPFPVDGSGNPVDLDGNSRYKNGRIDVGAYEHQGFQPDENNVLYVSNITPPASNDSGSSWSEALYGNMGVAGALRWAYLNRNEGLWNETSPLQIWVGHNVPEHSFFPVFDPTTDNLRRGNTRHEAFLMVKDVQVYGGFTATETALDQRNLAGRNSILYNGPGIERDHIVIFAGDAGTAVLDGFTITGGDSENHLGGSITVNGYSVTDNFGAGIYITNSSPLLSNLFIDDNRALSGGGIYNDNSNPEIINVSVTNNYGQGGGIYNTNSSPTLRNVLLADNLSPGGGGGIQNTSGSNPVLTNVTFSNNNSIWGGAVSNEGNSSSAFNNTILWGNSTTGNTGNQIYNDLSSSSVLNYSLYGNGGNDIEEGGGFTASNSVTTDPLFTDPGNQDYTPQGASVAVNNANNPLYTGAGGNLATDLDLALNPRVVNGTIDMGAFEFQAIPLPDAPFLTSPFDGSEDIHLPVTLDWETANGAEDYRVQVTLSGDSFDDAVFDEITTGTGIEVHGLGELTEYQWRVAGLNGTGQGEWSTVWSFTTREPFTPFITTWQTDNDGDSADNQITIPTAIGWTYDYDIYWEQVGNPANNGTINGVTGSHTMSFSPAGTYRVEITGIFPVFRFSDGGDKDKILSVEQWGNIQWGNMQGAFQGASNLVINAADAPNLENVTTMMNMFRDASSVNSDLSHWDVSNTSIMEGMFLRAASFNQDLGSWNISNVTNMTSMLSSSGLSVSNYDATLEGWAGQIVLSGVPLHAHNLEYCTSVDFRQSLISTYGWNISGDSLADGCTLDPEVPDTPLLSGPADDAEDIELPVTLIWQPSANANQYIVQVTEAGDSFDDAIFNEISSGLLIELSILEPSKEYQWRVAAENDKGQSDWSEVWSFTTGAGDPDPLELDAPLLSAPADDALDAERPVTLQWEAVEDAESYFVQVTLAGESFDDAAFENSTPNLQIDVSGLDELTEYNWRVQALADPDVESDWSAVWSFTTNNDPEPPTVTLRIEFSGGGAGSITSDPSGVIDCNSDSTGSCETEVPFEEPGIELIAAADAGSVFTEWCIITDEEDSEEFCFPSTDSTISFLPVEGILEPGTVIIATAGFEIAMEPFITTWKTDNEGTSDDDQITIPITGTGYDFIIDWGDGNQTAWKDGDDTDDLTYTYPAPGNYTVEITGDFPRIHFNNTGDRQKILSVEQWGEIAWSSMENAFYGASNLEINAADAPDLSGLTSMLGMFRAAISLNSDLNHWDVSNVENMGILFLGATSFNGNISDWNVATVTQMGNMFSFASSFNADISNWEVDNVTGMGNMFRQAGSFNRDISGWNVGNVTDMNGMFNGAGSFNQNISGWNVENVTNFNNTFNDAAAFDQDLGSWDISSAGFLQSMLSNSGLSVANYDAVLTGWAAQTVPSAMELGAEGLQYCDAIDARQSLIDNDGWDITGDSLAPGCISPEGENQRILAGNRSPYLFSGSDFGVANPAYSVKIETLPGHGNLLHDGAAAAANELIPVAGINNGDLVWEHSTDNYGYNYTSFEFRIVSDSAAESDEAYTMAIDLGTASVILTEDAGEGWRFLTSPSAGDTFADFLSPVYTQGIPGSVNPGTSPASLYKINQSAYEWEADFQMSDEIGVGEPFIVYLFEDDLPAELLSGDEWGPINGSYQYTGLWYDTGQGEHGNSHFLIANPHPVALDFCEFISGHVSPFVDIWNPAMGDGDYLNLVCGIDEIHIAPFQAFWVQTTADDPSLSIPEAAYLESMENGYFKERSAMSHKVIADLGQSMELPLLTLNAQSADGHFINRVQLLLADEETPETGQINAPKLSAAGLAQRWLSFYALGDNAGKYAFRTITESIDEPVAIPLNVETTDAGEFILNWNLPDSGPDAEYFLRDNQTEKIIQLNEGGSYRFKIDNDQTSGVSKTPEVLAPRFELTIAKAGAGMISGENDLPTRVYLDQNYPNPFNPATVIRYDLPQNTHVNLDVFDLTGRRIATLVDQTVTAGSHQVNFDANGLSSGVYIYRLQAASTVMTRKLTVIK